MKTKEKSYDELTFTDDYIFWRVLTTKLDLCKELLELILGKKITAITYSSPQKVIEASSDARGVRLDVYVEGETEVYNCEMQTSQKKSLPKRSRYYQGMIDLDLIERSDKYTSLKPSYIIFICTFDPFSAGLPVYTFENRCLEKLSLPLGDETVKKFVNGAAKGIEGKLGEFIRFLSGDVTGEFSERLQEAVRTAKKNKEWRREYMTLFMREQEKYEEGRADVLKKLLQANADKGLLQTAGYTEEEIKQALEELQAFHEI